MRAGLAGPAGRVDVRAACCRLVVTATGIDNHFPGRFYLRLHRSHRLVAPTRQPGRHLRGAAQHVTCVEQSMQSRFRRPPPAPARPPCRASTSSRRWSALLPRYVSPARVRLGAYLCRVRPSCTPASSTSTRALGLCRTASRQGVVIGDGSGRGGGKWARFSGGGKRVRLGSAACWVRTRAWASLWVTTAWSRPACT